MLYHLLFPLHDYFSILNVTRYITFRTAAASLTALLISLIFGPTMIRKLREFQVGQVIRHEGPASHRAKAASRQRESTTCQGTATRPRTGWPRWSGTAISCSSRVPGRYGSSASSNV